MKKSLVFPILGLMLSLFSCRAFYFEQPVPIDAKTISKMPRSLRGKWKGSEGMLTIDKKRWVSETTDSLGVTTEKVEFILSDSLILKKYKQYYFFNALNSNSYWNVYAGYKYDKYFIIKKLCKEDSLAFSTNLGLLPDSLPTGDLYYNTPINKKQIVKFIESGGFCDTLFLFDIKKRELLK